MIKRENRGSQSLHISRFDNLAAGQEAAYAATGGYESYDEYQAETPPTGFNPPAARSTPSKWPTIASFRCSG